MLDGVSGSLTEKQHSNLCRVKHNAERLTSRLNELLDFSNIESGKQELNVQCLAVMALLKKPLTRIPAHASG